MSAADLIRVVKRQDNPDMLGVVERERSGLIVLWSDGSMEQVDRYDTLLTHWHHRQWVVRVSHDPEHCERILAWHEAARTAWTPERREAERWGA